MSRFQRNLLTAFLTLCVMSATYLVFSYSRFRPANEPSHRKTSNLVMKSLPSEKDVAGGGAGDGVWGEGGREAKRIAVPLNIPKQSPNEEEGGRVEGGGGEGGGGGDAAVQDKQPEGDESMKGQLALPKLPHFKGPENDRQKAVADAMKYAWNGYKKYAWGKDHLKPVTRTHSTWMNMGLTIVDSLDTLLIMGLNEEYQEARDWVEKNLSFNTSKFVSLFETTIRVLGGLLSAFHLSGDIMFVDKAKDLGYRLSGAFDSPSRVPYCDVNLQSRKGKLPMWGADSSLSEITTLQLEFRDLSRVTGNPVFEELAFNVSKHVHKKGCSKFEGLCPMFMSPKTGEWKQGHTITLGARADSYYEYLLKQWLQTGKTIDWLKQDYEEAMQSMIKKLVRYSEPNKITFVGELLSEKTFSPKMDHLVCYIAGTLALGVVNGGLPREHMDLAKQIGHTCHEMYRNPTGLGPEIAHFNMIVTPNKQDLYVKPLDAHCLLRPEAIEAWFYLYRLSGEKIYQEWGWEAFQAIEKHAKLSSGGYSSVSNVKKIPVVYKDMQESFFLAETLKYLYLLLADDQTIIPLTQFVFNTEAHPLPIYKS